MDKGSLVKKGKGITGIFRYNRRHSVNTPHPFVSKHYRSLHSLSSLLYSIPIDVSDLNRFIQVEFQYIL